MEGEYWLNLRSRERGLLLLLLFSDVGEDDGRHRGTTPRFMAQPGLTIKQPLDLQRADDDHSPVERAIRLGLEAQAPPTSQ